MRLKRGLCSCLEIDKLFEGKGADNWISTLRERFKPLASKAYQELNTHYFTIDLVKKGLDVTEWADRIVRLSKETSAESRSSHLLAIYARLDPEKLERWIHGKTTSLEYLEILY